MAADEPGKDAPSLEPPSFGFRRRKKATKAEPEPAPVAAEPALEAEPVLEPEPIREPGPIAGPGRASPEPAPAPQVAPPTLQEQPVLVRHEPVVDEPVVDEPVVDKPEAGATPTVPVEPVDEPEPPRPPRASRRPVNGHLAAAITGLLAGLALVGATVGGLEVCETVRGSSACGNAGIPLLVAILVVVVMLGAALLRFLGVASAGSISFLAVALVAVLSTLFLLDSLEEVGGAVVVVVLSVGAFVLSHWVTTTYIDPADR